MIIDAHLDIRIVNFATYIVLDDFPYITLGTKQSTISFSL